MPLSHILSKWFSRSFQWSKQCKVRTFRLCVLIMFNKNDYLPAYSSQCFNLTMQSRHIDQSRSRVKVQRHRKQNVTEVVGASSSEDIPSLACLTCLPACLPAQRAIYVRLLLAMLSLYFFIFNCPLGDQYTNYMRTYCSSLHKIVQLVDL